MSTRATMHSEDLENVTLLGMENFQPQWNCIIYNPTEVVEEQELETCIVDNAIDYETECVINSDSVMYFNEEDSNSSSELIVPEPLAPRQFQVPIEIKEEKKCHPESWPTLEILPGGVIKYADKYKNHIEHTDEPQPVTDSREMTYACAKCSESFKYLFCLVKHVRWHEEQGKKQKETFSKISISSHKPVLQPRIKKKARSNTKTLTKKS